MEQPAQGRSPWPERRRRARQLGERYPFAAEVLTLYLALLDVQEPAFEAARARPPSPEAALGLVRGLLPRVVEATVAAGPATLGETTVARFHSADLDDVVGRWLRGAEQSLPDRYLARAASAPVLEAMEPDALATLCAASPSRPDGEGRGGGARCPTCGGLPQVGFFSESAEALVTGPRRLLCSRCSATWIHQRMVCAGCGEAAGTRLPVYSEAEHFPHVRIDGCETCHRYLLAVDPRRDAGAVPVVDELAALPLDLYAKERGLRKVVPNLMGF